MKKKVERLVTENPQETIWLRFNRLKSVKMCELLIEGKNLNLAEEQRLGDDLISKKAIGLSSAIESALGFWNSSSDSLNAKVLSRYYALLQLTIAEQVSSVKNKDDLERIQRHTEFGHGLATIRNLDDGFPTNFFVFVTRSGHFYSFAKSLGLNTRDIDFERRPRDYDSIEDKDKLISLIDLFRCIPELQPVIHEYLNVPPLSFQVVHSSKNMQIESEKMRQHIFNLPDVTSKNEEVEPKEKTTYISIIPTSQYVTLEYLNKLNLPIKNIKEEKSIGSEETLFGGEFIHPMEGYWYEYLDTYKSSHSGTSIIVPVLNKINDPILIHLMILYCLSIIVRYLPNVWYEITEGELDHIGSLIEYYLSIVDKVIPLKMLTRITETKILISMPGSLMSPV
ncbi:hypothetical protein ABEX38_29150 [Priestia megaterium]